MKRIASSANFNDAKKFTNSSGRKTAIPSLRDFNPLEIAELTGHANPESISSYSENPMEKNAHKLSGFADKPASVSSLSSRNVLADLQQPQQPQSLQVSLADSPAINVPIASSNPGLLRGAVSGLFTVVTFNNSPVNILINLEANLDRS